MTNNIDRQPLFNSLNNIVLENINNHDFYSTDTITNLQRKYNAIPFREEILSNNFNNFNECFTALVSLYGEMCVIRELIQTIGINKDSVSIIEESATTTPDIQVELNGKKIYFEVYTPILQETEKEQTQDELLNTALTVKTFRQFRNVDPDSKKIIIVMTIGKINLLVWSDPLLAIPHMENNPLDYSTIENILLSYETGDNEYTIIYGCPFVDGIGHSRIWCSDTDMKMKELSINEFRTIIYS